MRDGREETQEFSFPVESCRSFISLPCFKHFSLELWVAGSSPAPQPCGERRAPALPRHPHCYRQCSGAGTGTRPHHSPAPTPHLSAVPHSHPPPLPATRHVLSAWTSGARGKPGDWRESPSRSLGAGTNCRRLRTAFRSRWKVNGVKEEINWSPFWFFVVVKNLTWFVVVFKVSHFSWLLSQTYQEHQAFCCLFRLEVLLDILHVACTCSCLLIKMNGLMKL